MQSFRPALRGGMHGALSPRLVSRAELPVVSQACRARIAPFSSPRGCPRHGTLRPGLAVMSPPGRRSLCCSRQVQSPPRQQVLSQRSFSSANLLGCPESKVLSMSVSSLRHSAAALPNTTSCVGEELPMFGSVGSPRNVCLHSTFGSLASPRRAAKSFSHNLEVGRGSLASIVRAQLHASRARSRGVADEVSCGLRTQVISGTHRSLSDSPGFFTAGENPALGSACSVSNSATDPIASPRPSPRLSPGSSPVSSERSFPQHKAFPTQVEPTSSRQSLASIVRHQFHDGRLRSSINQSKPRANEVVVDEGNPAFSFSDAAESAVRCVVFEVVDFFAAEASVEFERDGMSVPSTAQSRDSLRASADLHASMQSSESLRESLDLDGETSLASEDLSISAQPSDSHRASEDLPFSAQPSDSLSAPADLSLSARLGDRLRASSDLFLSAQLSDSRRASADFVASRSSGSFHLELTASDTLNYSLLSPASSALEGDAGADAAAGEMTISDPPTVLSVADVRTVSDVEVAEVPAEDLEESVDFWTGGLEATSLSEVTPHSEARLSSVRHWRLESSAEQPVEQSAEQDADQSAGQSAGQAAEESSALTALQSADQSAGQSAEHRSHNRDRAQQSVWQSFDQSAGQNAWQGTSHRADHGAAQIPSQDAELTAEQVASHRVEHVASRASVASSVEAVFMEACLEECDEAFALSESSEEVAPEHLSLHVGCKSGKSNASSEGSLSSTVQVGCEGSDVAKLLEVVRAAMDVKRRTADLKRSRGNPERRTYDFEVAGAGIGTRVGIPGLPLQDEAEDPTKKSCKAACGKNQSSCGCLECVTHPWHWHSLL
uniref:Uncharacterized protein n=1 Tax=Noctiluca scintillans TaxID=2966 RepID=A0A6T9AIT9_NOCSC